MAPLQVNSEEVGIGLVEWPAQPEINEKPVAPIEALWACSLSKRNSNSCRASV